MKITRDLAEYTDKLKRNKIKLKSSSSNIMGSLLK